MIFRHGAPDARRVLEAVAREARRDDQIRRVRVPANHRVLVERAELVEARPGRLDSEALEGRHSLIQRGPNDLLK